MMFKIKLLSQKVKILALKVKTPSGLSCCRFSFNNYSWFYDSCCVVYTVWGLMRVWYTWIVLSVVIWSSASGHVTFSWYSYKSHLLFTRIMSKHYLLNLFIALKKIKGSIETAQESVCSDVRKLQSMDVLKLQNTKADWNTKCPFRVLAYIFSNISTSYFIKILLCRERLDVDSQRTKKMHISFGFQGERVENKEKWTYEILKNEESSWCHSY